MIPSIRPPSLPALSPAAPRKKHSASVYRRYSIHIFPNPFSQPHLHPIWISFSATTRARDASTRHPLARGVPTACPPAGLHEASRRVAPGPRGDNNAARFPKNERFLDAVFIRSYS